MTLDEKLAKALDGVLFGLPSKSSVWCNSKAALCGISVDNGKSINRAIRRAVRLARAAGFAEGIEKAAMLVEERTSSQAFEERTGRTASVEYIPSANGQELAAAIRKATPDAK